MLNFGLSCYYTLMVFVLVDIGTVIYGPLMDDLGFSVEVLNWSFGANTAGLAVGCVIFIPFALKFGRRPVYLISIAICLATAIWQARMQTAGDQYGSGVVSGLAGSIAETICQMTVADLFFVHQRATANGVYLLLVNVGAFLAPVAAGYAADAQGWRWSVLTLTLSHCSQGLMPILGFGGGTPFFSVYAWYSSCSCTKRPSTRRCYQRILTS